MPRVKLFDEEEVLEKAMDLFWKKGYHATSIQDLVNHLGINRASLYDTYGGKKYLFQRAFARYRDSNRDAIKNYLESQKDIKTGFRNLFDMALKQSSSDEDKKGCFVVNSTIEFIPNEKEFSVFIQEHKKRFEGIFRDYIALGIERKQISKDKNPEVIASLFFTFYNGLKVVTKVDFDEAIFSDSVDSLLSILD
ncbi:MAG: TetR/AcrR family transcriptional regulator [Bacteroidia bacterium]|nr:TetR/AcrR family transcriptional regulator [Bacteroidia bacterium]